MFILMIKMELNTGMSQALSFSSYPFTKHSDTFETVLPSEKHRVLLVAKIIMFYEHLGRMEY